AASDLSARKVVDDVEGRVHALRLRGRLQPLLELPRRRVAPRPTELDLLDAVVAARTLESLALGRDGRRRRRLRRRPERAPCHGQDRQDCHQREELQIAASLAQGYVKAPS